MYYIPRYSFLPNHVLNLQWQNQVAILCSKECHFTLSKNIISFLFTNWFRCLKKSVHSTTSNLVFVQPTPFFSCSSLALIAAKLGCATLRNRLCTPLFKLLSLPLTLHTYVIFNINDGCGCTDNFEASFQPARSDIPSQSSSLGLPSIQQSKSNIPS